MTIPADALAGKLDKTRLGNGAFPDEGDSQFAKRSEDSGS